MTILEFATKYGTTGPGLMVRRAVSEPHWSPNEWAYFYNMLNELESALKEVTAAQYED